MFRTTNRGKTVLDLYGMLPITTSQPGVEQMSQFEQTGFGGDIPIDALSDLSLSWNIVNTSNHKWLNATVRMKSIKQNFFEEVHCYFDSVFVFS